MFDNFDELDMYGFLDYLEESSQVYNEEAAIMESLGIYEDENYYYVEDSVLAEVMEAYNLSESEAFYSIMESFIEALSEGNKDFKYKVIDMEQGPDGKYQMSKHQTEHLPAVVNTPAVQGKKEGTPVNPHYQKQLDGPKAIEGPRQSQMGGNNEKLDGPRAIEQNPQLQAPRGMRKDLDKKEINHGTIHQGQNKQLPYTPKKEPAPWQKADFSKKEDKPKGPDAKTIEAQVKTKRALDDKDKITKGIAQTKKDIQSAQGRRDAQTSAYKSHMDNINKDYDRREATERADSASRSKRNMAIGAAAGAAAVGGAVLARKAYKTHQAKKRAAEEAARRRNRKGLKRFLREDAEFINESIDFLIENYGVLEDEAIDLICYGESNDAQKELEKQQGKVQRGQQHLDSLNSELDGVNKGIQSDRESYERGITNLHGARTAQLNNLQATNKRNERISGVKGAAGGALAAGAVVGSAALAHKAYKNHKAKKEAEARRNRGLRGKLRRLREDYGIFEDENGQLFIENEMVEYVMDEYDLYEEDAIEAIMEAYEEELYND